MLINKYLTTDNVTGLNGSLIRGQVLIDIQYWYLLKNNCGQ